VSMINVESPAEWRVADLETDQSWVYDIDDAARRDLTQVIKAAYVPDLLFLIIRATTLNLARQVQSLPRRLVKQSMVSVLHWCMGCRAKA